MKKYIFASAIVVVLIALGVFAYWYFTQPNMPVLGSLVSATPTSITIT